MIHTDSRVPRTVYRHLVRWCRQNKDIPVAWKFPVIHHLPPDCNERLFKKLPPQTVQPTNVQELLKFVRILFRSHCNDDKKKKKKRLDDAFHALREVNRLTTQVVLPLKHERESHRDRTGVLYRVGQVVRHADEKWRGVVVGWKKSINKTIEYEVIIDMGDAHLRGKATGYTNVQQPELQSEERVQLKRVRNILIDSHFDGLDAAQQSFVPQALLAYKYPHDLSSYPSRDMPDARTNNLCFGVRQGIQSFAAELISIIEEEEVEEELHGLYSSLCSLVMNDTVPSQSTPSVFSTVALLQSLMGVTEKIIDTCRHRSTIVQKVNFQLGDVVNHQVFGYRAVVVGWDPRPMQQYSHWDEVKDIVMSGGDPKQLPFFHLVSDSDSDKLDWNKYACQDNLILCDTVGMRVDLSDQGWKSEHRADGIVRYIPPASLKFRYGEKDDTKNIARCMTRLLEHINTVQSRASNRDVPERGFTVNAISASNLMTLLRSCDRNAEAMVLQEALSSIRQANKKVDLRFKLASGSAETRAGNISSALAIFKSIVESDDKTYAEAWYLRSHCEFLLGLTGQAITSASKAIELDDQHVAAISGLGVSYMHEGDTARAAEYFCQALQLDPWCPIAPRLAQCLDHLQRIEGSPPKNTNCRPVDRWYYY